MGNQLSKTAMVVLLLVIILGAIMWILQPEKAMAWAAAMFVMPVILGGVTLWKRAKGCSQLREKDRSTISRSVIGAGLILATSLGLTLAENFEFIDGTLTERGMGAVIGLMLVVMGNFLPKSLEPLSKERCDPAKKQSLQRFAGWVFVLAGLGYVLSWLILPLDLAGTVSTLFAASAVTLVVLRLAWILLNKPGETPANTG